MPGLCQCWLRSLSSALWWLLIGCTHSACAPDTVVLNKCSKACLFWPGYMSSSNASINSPFKSFLSFTLWSLLLRQHWLCWWLYTALWSDLYTLCTTETVLLAIFFSSLPCWGKLYGPLFIHQVKLFNMYRNGIDLSMTLALGESRLDMCLWIFTKLPSLKNWKNLKLQLKHWKPRKFDSFWSPSGNLVLPLLVFTPLTSLDVMQEQMQLTVMRKLNLHSPALSGLPSEFVVGFGAICYTYLTIRKAILYFCWAFYLSAVAKGALL